MQQRSMDRHIKLSLGTLYHTFEQLQRHGWVRPTETEREGRRPERTVYTLTDDGRREFLSRLRELIAEPVSDYSSLEAGLAFMHRLDADEAAGLLRRRAETLTDEIERTDLVHETLREKGLSRLSLIEVELVQDMRRFQIEWVRRIAAEIESGNLEWQAGFTNAARLSGGDDPAAEPEEVTT
jgi:DNA-binding PadR family transcriptional regulator